MRAHRYWIRLYVDNGWVAMYLHWKWNKSNISINSFSLSLSFSKLSVRHAIRNFLENTTLQKLIKCMHQIPNASNKLMFNFVLFRYFIMFSLVKYHIFLFRASQKYKIHTSHILFVRTSCACHVSIAYRPIRDLICKWYGWVKAIYLTVMSTY